METIRVLYDYQAFELQTHGGISRSFVELITHMPNYIEASLKIKESNNIYLSEYGLVSVSPLYRTYNSFLNGISFKGKGRLFNALSLIPFFHNSTKINQNVVLDSLKNDKFDVFHPTFLDSGFLPYIKKKPVVVTIHDLITAKYPQYFKHTQTKAQKIQADAATHIIAVSENTKKDIIEILDVSPSKVSVVHHGAPNIDWKMLELLPRIFSFDYFLYVGNRMIYKNFFYLLDQSCEILKETGFKIVCTGYPFSCVEKEKIKSMGLEQSVIHCFVSSEELYSLYKYAKAFVYPSCYEGFGIPILESFLCKCPVILNNASCFPEIAGDAAIYFNENGPYASLREVLKQFMELSPLEVDEYKQKGLERVKLFSWEESAKKMASIYKNIL